MVEHVVEVLQETVVVEGIAVAGADTAAQTVRMAEAVHVVESAELSCSRMDSEVVAH